MGQSTKWLPLHSNVNYTFITRLGHACYVFSVYNVRHNISRVNKNYSYAHDSQLFPSNCPFLCISVNQPASQPVANRSIHGWYDVQCAVCSVWSAIYIAHHTSMEFQSVARRGIYNYHWLQLRVNSTKMLNFSHCAIENADWTTDWNTLQLK